MTSHHPDMLRLVQFLYDDVESEASALELLEPWVDTTSLIKIADGFERGMLESQPTFKRVPRKAQLGLGLAMNLGFQYGFLIGVQFQAAGGHRNEREGADQ